MDENCLKNTALKDEYLLYKEEIISTINEELKEYFSEANREVWFRNKRFQETSLLNITFEYLKEKYPNYIEINYELVNKDKLSFPMKKVRQTLVDMLIKSDKELEVEEFYKNTGAINSVARTVLRKIIEIYNGEIYFIEKWKELEEKIVFDIKKENYSLKQLYDDFITDKRGYGLRKGVFTK